MKIYNHASLEHKEKKHYNLQYQHQRIMMKSREVKENGTSYGLIHHIQKHIEKNSFTATF